MRSIIFYLVPLVLHSTSIKILRKEGNTLKIYLEFMQKNFYKDNVIEYWRNVDKKIFFIFLSLFLLGLFFSLSSTSTLAGERLDKDNYFFFL